MLRGKWLLEQHLRLAGAAAAAGRGHEAAENKPGARAADDPRAAGAAPARIRCAAAATRSIDPLGFALENFDVIGGWRTMDEAGKPVDASGSDGRAARQSKAWRAARAAARQTRSSFREP